ncbi:MAG: hypothetical protein HND53_00960 [Proteobacteria bacterium]|nr:hypothetical protein [Pseudomonadota bacterium]NOG59043.1 hypothetical protein [Pseudomonadota bacterium]
MNGINSIRLDLNTARYSSAVARGKVSAIEKIDTATEANKKKQQLRTRLSDESNSKQNQFAKRPELLLSDSKFYRANLLNDIVNKMSGLEEGTSPGHYVEYYA